jgi:hypothetical protein
VPAIEWKFNRNSLGKSEMIVMDILANNNWERPVYFASLGHTGTLGLEDFVQLEGFAYRLVPIKSRSIGRFEAGRIESNILYENLMNKFRWGAMNDPEVYLDDFHVRTMSIVRLRNRFIQLADELISRRDTARAIAVLDRCLELTPDEKIPYDHTIIQIANAYYKCNQIDKANGLVIQLRDKCSENLAYYLDQQQHFIASINDQVMYNFQIIQNLMMMTNTFNQPEISASLDSLSASRYEVYTRKSSAP